MTPFDPEAIASTDELGDLPSTAQLGDPELVAGQCNGFLSLAVQDWYKPEQVTSFTESFERALGNLAINHAWRPFSRNRPSSLTGVCVDAGEIRLIAR
jgi:hypothetical protein